uniref:Leucine-rich repeat-containing N-terminal plant-type domain-containing protein n=1 Tax=Tetradesmus obliquus TaxID=3088 RepID=A0A383WMK6_TETOB|eukprot:jgi/Sobl393_1/19306/SZX78675.1
MLKYFDLSNNKLSGSLPDILGWLRLSVLRLSENEFTGGVPISWAGHFKALNVPFYEEVLVDLQSNRLSGAFPRSATA